MTYSADNFEYGLICSDCKEPFAEGQPIAERLESFVDDIPLVILICVKCDLKGEENA